MSDPTPMPEIPESTPKFVRVPFGLVVVVAQYLEATPTARDVSPSTPVGMALQLSQHAEMAMKRHQAQQAKAIAEEVDRVRQGAGGVNGGANAVANGGRRKPMDQLMAEARAAKAAEGNATA